VTRSPEPAIPLRKNRDFRLLWLGEAVSMFGSQLSAVAFPLLVLQLTGSPFRAGLVGTVGLAPMALLSLPFGVVADRIDRKWALVCSNIVGALALLSLGVAIWIDEVAYAHILAVAFVVGCVTTFVRIAEEGVIAQIVPRHQLGEAVSQNVARQYAAGLLGPAVGGVTFAASRALPFLIDAVTYVCSLAAMLGIRTRFQEERTPSSATAWEDVREAVRWIWRRPFLRDSLLLVAGSNFVPTYLILIVAAKGLGASPAVIGVVLALYSVGGLAGSAAAPWLQPRVPVPVVVSGFVWLDAAVFLALAFVGEPLMLGVLIAVTAFVGPLWDAVVVGYRLAITPDRLQGRVASVDWFLSVSLAAVGPIVVGYLLSKIGTHDTLLIVAGLLAVFATLGTAAPSLRQAPALLSPRD
jgi:MFS family permease